MNSGKKNRLKYGLPYWALRLLGAVLVLLAGVVPAKAQIASFSFAGPSTVSGWTNISGDPRLGVQTATAGGITLSSVGTANWSANSNGNCAVNGFGASSGVYFPAAVMSNSWIQYNGTNNNLALYNALLPQIALSGLNPDSVYILRMTGSNVDFQGATQYTVAGRSVAGSQNLTTYNNTSQGVTFQAVAPDSTGVIRVYVSCPGGLSGTSFAWICGLQVYSGSADIRTPQVAISAPLNGAIQPEGGNVAIDATASEPGSAIAKVEFYEDTVKIGEVDTVPYNFTWLGPEPGSYLVSAMATDNVGTINTASVSIAIKSLNYFWSTTGNIGNNADSTFIGNVDSVRLDFRTKDIQRMSILATGHVGIGTIAPTAQLHTTGSVRLAGLAVDSTGADPRILVSDSNGNLAYRGPGSSGSGLGGTASGALALGDTISGAGPHSFSANRFEYLNGFQYSIGGTVNDPVNVPNFRIYDNGDLTAGTTMDRSVGTNALNGMRYYSKLSALELGASDRLDTALSKFVQGSWPGSGLVINSDDSNKADPKLLNSIYLGDANTLNPAVLVTNSLLAIESSAITAAAGSLTGTVFTGDLQTIISPVDNSFITGLGNNIIHPQSGVFLGGFENAPLDTARYSLVAGSVNEYGGVAQVEVGQFLDDRTPFGAVFGSANVEFTSLSFTGTRGVAASGLAGYPLFALGNSAAISEAVHSNAVTVSFNGRTQINTTGCTVTLTQAAVTPKAALEVVSSNTGVLLPGLTGAQQSAIQSSDLLPGLLLYNTDAGLFQFYNGSEWVPVGASANSIHIWDQFGNGSTSPAGNFVGTTDVEPLVFRADDTVRMTILANGAVGIGTSAPQQNALLAVAGTIYAQKIEAIETGWPDYVFERGYALMPLPGLENYIRQHRRLPGVIAARDVEKNGVDLGHNQVVLLQKVEELTLYIIEAHKKAARRQQEIDRLKASANRLDQQQQELAQLKQQLGQLLSQNK